MSQQQPGNHERKVRRFDRWLVMAPESDFEEFINEGSKSFDVWPLTLLRACKASVDARLAAQPKKRVTFASNPRDVRVSYWHEIAKTFEAEINWRLGKSAEVAGDSVQPRRRTAPEVVKRRSIVKANSTKSAQDLCKLFDSFNVPVVWDESLSWAEGYRDPKLRHSIQSLISRDKSSGEPK